MLPSSTKIVLFDIDHTLFDTRAYLFQCFAELERLLASESKLNIKNLAQEIYASQRKYAYFSPKIFSEELKLRVKTNQSLQTFENVFYNGQNLEKSLYKDTLPTLKKLSEQNIALGIFSGGDKILQEKKLHTLYHLLHQRLIYIFDRDKHEAIREVVSLYKTQKLYVVDDLLSVLAEFKSANNAVCTIWIVRSEEVRLKQQKIAFNADFVVSSLSDLLPIVAK
jgi:FMN phosphatase YigB (HAD superfamily)